MEVFQGRWEDAEVDIIELKEQRQNAESSLAASRLEAVELHVEVEDLRYTLLNLYVENSYIVISTLSPDTSPCSVI
jgi:hypothetical protein